MRVPRGLPPFSPLALVAATVAKARGHFYGAAAIQGFLVTVIAEVVCPSDDVGISAWQARVADLLLGEHQSRRHERQQRLHSDDRHLGPRRLPGGGGDTVLPIRVFFASAARCEAESGAAGRLPGRALAPAVRPLDVPLQRLHGVLRGAAAPLPDVHPPGGPVRAAHDARLLRVDVVSRRGREARLGDAPGSLPISREPATFAYLLVYAGSLSQWPYEYSFYEERGLTRRDVYVLLGVQQLAVLLGPYLAWLLFRRRSPRTSVLPPKTTASLFLLATVAACEAKRRGFFYEASLVMGLGPSVAATLLDIKSDVIVVRHLEAYVTFTSWVATCLLVEVCGLRKEWIIGMAAALYLSAAVTVWLDRSPKLAARAAEPAAEIDGPVEEDPCVWQRGKLDGPLASPEGWLDAALCRTTALLEDMAALTLRAAQFLLEAVAVLNRDVFELNGDYPFTRVMNSFPSVLIFRKCCESISSCVANISSDDVTTKMKLTAAGSVICIAGLSASFHYAELSGPDYGTEHALVALGTTMATERSALTPLWHCRTMAGLLATAILLWPCDVPDEEFAVKKVWMSDLVCVAFSLVVTGALLAYWWPVRRARIEHAPLYSNC
ncbi:uncharacterized protein [Dermacentor albipictus]